MRLHIRQIMKHYHFRKVDRILEVGCHRGSLVRQLMKSSRYVIGIDIDESVVKSAGLKNLCVANAEDLSFKDQSFDVLIACHTIEHIVDLERTSIEFSRVLKPEGRLILIYPWEPIIGIACLYNYLGSRKSNKTHKHKLDPRKIKDFFGNKNLQHFWSRIYFAFFPMYITIFKKVMG